MTQHLVVGVSKITNFGYFLTFFDIVESIVNFHDLQHIYIRLFHECETTVTICRKFLPNLGLKKAAWSGRH